MSWWWNSEEAANYDNKHRKLNERLTHELQTRLDFIDADWASDDDSDEDDDDDKPHKPRREVRLLDYACGTGMMSRVSLILFLGSGFRIYSRKLFARHGCKCSLPPFFELQAWGLSDRRSKSIPLVDAEEHLHGKRGLSCLHAYLPATP